MFDIMELLKKGRLRTDITITHVTGAVSTAPPKGFLWILIGGIVNHVTASNSITFVRNNPDSDITLAVADTHNWAWYSMIISDEVSGTYPLFSNVAEPYVAAPQLIVIDDQSRLWFAGTANAYFHPIIIEVKL